MTVGDYPGKVDTRWLIPPDTFKSDYDIKRFIDVAGPAGLAINELSGASAVEDFDGDGLLDVIVTSIGLRDQMHFFHNNGDGTFSDRTREAGLIGLTGGLNIVTADYNNDGLLDLHATNMSSTAGNRILNRLFPNQNSGNNVLKKLAAGNDLFENLGNGFYKDVTADVGGLSGQWAWGGGFIDFDNDGWEDLYTPNGFISGKSMADT